MKPIEVILAHRCAGAFWSIEELFCTVSGAFPPWVKATQASAPHARADLRSMVGNLRWMRSLGPCDVLHLTGALHYAALGSRRDPLVLTIHDLRFIDEARGLRRFWFWLWWLYLPCLRATRVTVISEFTKQRLLAVGRVHPAKVRVIPNCVAPEFAAASKPWPADRARLLQVGTTENKNLARVIQACSGLAVRLCILGRLSESQRAQLSGHGVEYEDHQDLSKEQVVALYQSCDLLVFVSTYEGFGMPILEAQAVGRPALTSDISPMRDVAGDGALMVDPLDVAAIRSGLVRLLEEPALREQLVHDGFRNVTGYSAESVAMQYADLYREALGGGAE